jgi:hypothetical protein
LSITFSALSIASLLMNLFLLYTAQSLGNVDYNKHGPFDQFQASSSSHVFSVFVILECLWTHGVLIALSNFIFESYAVCWYFNERVQGRDYSRITNIFKTFGLLVWHFGTIAYGAIIAYTPERFNTWLNNL